ncbi:MAG: hypothetical protein ACLFNV_03755 [Desulfovibrionales bacterium]
MLKAGGKAGVAARQAEELIRELSGSDHLDQKLSGKLTKKGEARMENCFKFDLVSGYRLVVVKRDGNFVFLFLGTHDETDKWIKNNAGLTLDLSKGEVLSSSRDHEPTQRENFAQGTEPLIDDYDKPLHEILDQNTLRDIFRGLCTPPGKTTGC